MALTANRRQRGQATTEAILLLVLIVVSINLLFKGLKTMKFTDNLTVNPMEKISGMVECGVWAACGISSGAKVHPSNRVVSFKPVQEGG